MRVDTLKVVLAFLFVAQSTFAQIVKTDMVPNMPYLRYELNIKEDTVNFYLSTTSNRSDLPLVAFVQGSGTNSLFIKGESGKIFPQYGHVTWVDAAQENYRILIVEKPGIKFLQTGQSLSFDSRFSLESFSTVIVDAINYVLQNERIDTNKVLIVGHSEGGIVAARVTNIMPDRISNVAIMAGEGPPQLYSLYKLAEDGTFFNSKEHSMPTSEMRLRYLKDNWDDILSDPRSTEKKFWGFTYLRWSSMLRTSVIDELAPYHGKILFIQGTNDKAVHPESAIVAYTSLLAKGKRVELQLIESADHSFNIIDKPNTDGWKVVLERVLDWFMSKD